MTNAVPHPAGMPPQTLTAPRPLLRGTFHLLAAVLAPFGLVLLLLLADSPRAYVSAAIFATSLILLYVTSASYHLVPWPMRLKGIMRRADHSMIFVLIAGSYTPFCLMVLGTGWGISMLSIVWSLAGVGVLLKILWLSAPRWFGVGAYLTVGWLAIIPAYELTKWFEPGQTLLLLAGALCYTLGGLAYATKWPNPSPRFFGFHEVFHVLVVAGSAVHFALIAVYVL